MSKEQKIKWSYDKKHKEWFTGESSPWANDGMVIKKVPGGYGLFIDSYSIISPWVTCKRLRATKLMAHYKKFG